MTTDQAFLIPSAAPQALAPAVSARLTTYSAVVWIVSQLRAAGRVATVTHRGNAWRVTA